MKTNIRDMTLEQREKYYAFLKKFKAFFEEEIQDDENPSSTQIGSEGGYPPEPSEK